jgi:hypothetical protein
MAAMLLEDELAGAEELAGVEASELETDALESDRLALDDDEPLSSPPQPPNKPASARPATRGLNFIVINSANQCSGQ